MPQLLMALQPEHVTEFEAGELVLKIQHLASTVSKIEDEKRKQQEQEQAARNAQR